MPITISSDALICCSVKKTEALFVVIFTILLPTLSLPAASKAVTVKL